MCSLTPDRQSGCVFELCMLELKRELINIGANSFLKYNGPQGIYLRSLKRNGLVGTRGHGFTGACDINRGVG